VRETDADFFGGEKVRILEELGYKRFSEFPEEVSQQRGKAETVRLVESTGYWRVPSSARVTKWRVGTASNGSQCFGASAP